MCRRHIRRVRYHQSIRGVHEIAHYKSTFPSFLTYLLTYLPSVTACKSDALTTSDAGPIAEPCIILSDVGLNDETCIKGKADRTSGSL